jgi:hypothetical protein
LNPGLLPEITRTSVGKRTVSDDEFINAWRKLGSPNEVSKATGVAIRAVYSRRANLLKQGIVLSTISNQDTPYSAPTQFDRRRRFEVTDGAVVLFSDPHWLPDHSTTAHDALEAVIQEIKPVGVICGGDAVDGDTISRWDPTRGHHKRFSVREELECVQMHFQSLDRVIPKNTWKAWTLGNHDVRLSRFIAIKAPELMDMPMTRLEDWAPGWPLSWTVEINSGTAGMTVVRHRNQAGMLHLQAVKAGCHYAHGHLHKLNVHRMPTFNGVRYGIDAGSLADASSEGFDYAEGGIEHAQGFAVLTFKGGKLMPPELCEVVDGQAWFRGQAI